MAGGSRCDNLDDGELLRQYRATKDKKWLGALLERHTLLLLGVAMKYLKDKTQSEDAVQQVFLKIISNFPDTEIQNFKGWIYILMRNHCLTQLRDQGKVILTDKIEDIGEVADEPVDLGLNNYTSVQLAHALNELNEEQRKVIILFYLKNLSYEKIMQETGSSFQQVKSYIQNGKRNLKNILQKINSGNGKNE